MNILKLNPGDILIHDLLGYLTIIKRYDEEEGYLEEEGYQEEGYLVIYEEIEIIEPVFKDLSIKIRFIDFQEVIDFCLIKK